MTQLSLWLIIALVLSFTISIAMWWYLRKLLSRFIFLSQNLADLAELVENYQKHLKQLNNMEGYHGDETIEYLLRHTNSLIEILDDYTNVYDIIEPLQEEQETPINDREENNPTPPEAEEIEISEKDVFYAGTRRRDN